MRAGYHLLVFALLVVSALGQGYGICSSSGTQTLTSPTGELGCSSYANLITKNWLIQAQAGQRILLTFDAFDTEANYDFIKIYDGPTASSDTLMGSFAGSTIPGPFRSSSTSLYVSFHSDEYVSGNGFHASWQPFQLADGVISCTSSGSQSLTGSSGSFGCDGYGNSVVRTWLITANAQEKIMLNFLDFETERAYDWVDVFDGPSESSTRLAHYSGSDVPPPVTASGNQLYVKLTSDPNIHLSGFTATWDSIASVVDICYKSSSQITVNPEGYIGCPYGYGNDVHSSWLIHPPGDVVIQLDFLMLNLQANRDYLRVYDGLNASAPLIGSFSGITTPGQILSSNNSLFITLDSDSTTTQNGFTLTYRSYDKILAGGCASSGNYTLTQETDTFGCDHYSPGITISWLIQAQRSQVLRLGFASFSTESGHDYLTIYDGDSTSAPLVQYSGTTIPEPFISAGTYLLVVFESDSNGVTGSGFSALYENVPVVDTACQNSNNYYLTEQQGDFGCYGYGNSVVETWRIEVDDGYQILLQFNSFYTEAADVLTVYDGPSDQYTVLGRYSGIFRPSPISSNSNFLYLRFVSDAHVTRSGFSITYTSVYTGSDSQSCEVSASYSLTEPEDSFGCTGYGSNVAVTWLITTEPGSRVSLEFASFQTEYSFDLVRVYNGNSDLSPIIQSFSGFSVPLPVESTSNQMFVKFTSDASLSYDGFTAHYRTILTTTNRCNTSQSYHLTDPSGEFGCAEYSNSIDSNWTITAHTGERISLSFSLLDTELLYDYIKIYDGDQASIATLMNTFSGSSTPNAIMSTTSNKALVTFHSDSSVSSGYLGFSLMYSTYGSFGDNTCLTSGAYELTDSSGEFGCSGYGNNVEISWTITSYGPIYLYFSRFDTETNYDWVSIYDGNSASAPLLARYSGSHSGSVVSTGMVMFVQFSSDNAATRTGFNAEYSTLIINREKDQVEGAAPEEIPSQ